MIEILFWILFGLAFIIIIGGFITMLNPNIQGKMLSKQIKSLKQMMDESKDDIKSISDEMTAATKDSLEATARTIKKGLTSDEDKICPYCQSKIDKDSKFCKYCGKEI